MHLACYTQEQIAEAVGMTHQAVSKLLQHIADLEFVANLGTGVGVLLEEIPDLQFVLNVGACLKFCRKLQICKFRQILATSGVGKVLKQIPNLEFVSNLGDFSNIADDAARQEGRAEGVCAAGWAWRKSDTRMDSSCECG